MLILTLNLHKTKSPALEILVPQSTSDFPPVLAVSQSICLSFTMYCAIQLRDILIYVII